MQKIYIERKTAPWQNTFLQACRLYKAKEKVGIEILEIMRKKSALFFLLEFVISAEIMTVLARFCFPLRKLESEQVGALDPEGRQELQSIHLGKMSQALDCGGKAEERTELAFQASPLEGQDYWTLGEMSPNTSP